jgi:ABC-type transport system involved in Fe-S cluster assembly fused permease/ATPase subunit
MSTISKADEIYCLENWVISYSGNHKNLLAEGKNPYARFYKAQILHE